MQAESEEFYGAEYVDKYALWVDLRGTSPQIRDWVSFKASGVRALHSTNRSAREKGLGPATQGEAKRGGLSTVVEGTKMQDSCQNQTG